MNIGIIGCGIVGGVIKKYIETQTNHNLLLYDPGLELDDKMETADIIFISVPVPTKGFKQDLSILKEAVEMCPYNVPVYIRSSVVPGTTDNLFEWYLENHNKYKPIYAMPEFLTERTCYDDFIKQKTHIIGKQVHQEHLELLKKALPHKEFVEMKSAEAEFVKYSHNVFAAMKVSFFNGIYDLAQKENCDYEVIREWVPKVTGFISDKHLMVPGPDGKRGWGGKCFPPNLTALIGYAGNDPFHLLLKDVFCLNTIHRNK